MIKIVSVYASVAAGTVTEQALATLTVPDGHTFNVLEIAPKLGASCKVYCYMLSERVAEFDNNVRVDTQRNVVNWVLKPGAELKVTATNGSGGALPLGAEITFDDVV